VGGKGVEEFGGKGMRVLQGVCQWSASREGEIAGRLNGVGQQGIERMGRENGAIERGSNGAMEWGSARVTGNGVREYGSVGAWERVSRRMTVDGRVRKCWSEREDEQRVAARGSGERERERGGERGGESMNEGMGREVSKGVGD
jgi:hypothetical protein